MTIDIQELQQLFRECRDVNELRRAKLLEDIAFYRGMQHLMPNQYEEPDKNPSTSDPRVMYEVIQKCRPAIRQEVAFFVNSVPKYSCAPSGPGVLRRAMADAKMRIASSFMRTSMKYRETRYYSRLAAAIYGASWVKVFWNPYIGPADPTQYPSAKGNFDLDYFDGLDIIADTRATNRHNVRFVFHLQTLPESDAEAAFPVDINGQPMKGQFQPYGASQAPHGAEIVAGRDQNILSKKNRLVQLIAHWVKPNGLDKPYGELVVFSGERIIAHPKLEDGTPTLPDGIWPWTLKTGLNKVPKKLYPDGILTDIKSLQVSINHAASRSREQLNMASMHHYSVHKNAKIRASAIDNMDGTIIEWDGPIEPKWNQAPGPSQAIESYKQGLNNDFNEVSTHNEASRGVMQSSQANARLMAYQAQLAASIHQPDKIMADDEDIEIIENILILIKNNYDESRMLTIFGEDDLPLAMTYKESDIDWDAKLLSELSAPTPVSTELAEAKALEVLNAGGFSDTPEAERFRRAVGRYYDGADMRDRLAEHRRNARNDQIAYLKYARIPQVRPQDNHSVHITEHEGFIVSEEFFQTDEQLQMDFLSTIAARQELLLSSQQDISMQQQIASGTVQQPQEQGSQKRGSGGRGTASPIDGGNSNQVDNIAQDALPEGN